MDKMTFSMHLSAEKYLLYYQGTAKDVIVKSEDGRTLKFPANRLQKFVTRDGIAGRFEIIFDNNHKIVSLKRLS
jgi:hypothetical protein